MSFFIIIKEHEIKEKITVNGICEIKVAKVAGNKKRPKKPKNLKNKGYATQMNLKSIDI